MSAGFRLLQTGEILITAKFPRTRPTRRVSVVAVI
jgi:hypothetical protein